MDVAIEFHRLAIARIARVSAPRIIFAYEPWPDYGDAWLTEERRWSRGKPEGSLFMNTAHLASTVEPLVRTVAHFVRHAYQLAVVDARTDDRRMRPWRVGWGYAGPFGRECPDERNCLEQDAGAVEENVWEGFCDETNRQLGLIESLR